MGPVGFDTDRDRPQGKSELEVVLASVPVIVGVTPCGTYNVGPGHSCQIGPGEVRVVQIDVLECSTAQIRVAHVRPVHVEVVEVAVLHVGRVKIEVRLLEVVEVRVTEVRMRPHQGSQ